MQQIDSTTYSTNHDHLEIVVGDEKQKAFYPRVKLKAWNNEANFSVGLKDTKGTHRQRGEKIIYSSRDVTADFYPTNVNELPTIDNKDCQAFEFSITLPDKPDSNVIFLTIRTKGLTFNYQPALTKNEAKHSTRPENVSGSYAVYHESKMNNDYKTGKAFHIYRPWAEDSAGVRVWCELHIPTDDKGRATKDEITITVPQDFIDNAVYPVLIDPTFGYTSIGASTTGAGNKILLLGNIPGGRGNVGAPFSYGTPTTGGGSLFFQWGIYTSSGVFVGQTLEAGPYTSTQATTWWGGLSTINAGATTNYDIAIWSNLPSAGENFVINYDTLTNAGKNQTETYTSSIWPATITPSTDNNRYSMYALYTAAAIVRYTHQTASGTSATSSVSGTYPASTTVGNLLVASVWVNTNSNSTSISGWTLAKEQAATGAGKITILCKVADGTETSISASHTGASLMRITITEYSGLMRSSTGGTPDTIAETDGATTASATTASCGSVTTTTPNDMLFAAIGFVAGNTSSPSFDNSFATVTSDARMVVGDRIVTATGTYTTNASWTTSRASASAIVAFRHLFVKAHSALGVG